MPFPRPDAIWRGDICGVAEQTQICWYLHLSQQLGRQREGRSLTPRLAAVDFWEQHSVLLAPPMTQCAVIAAHCLTPPSSFLFVPCILLVAYRHSYRGGPIDIQPIYIFFFTINIFFLLPFYFFYFYWSFLMLVKLFNSTRVSVKTVKLGDTK